MDEIQKKDIPIYPHSLDFAVENGELEQYRQSSNAHHDCAAAIAKAINDNYSGYSLNTDKAIKQVTEVFGNERTEYILANSVQLMSRDGRISQDNKDWAKTYPVVEDIDPWGGNRNRHYAVLDFVHPGLLNMFVKEFRQEHEQERKPSIREQLASMQEQSKQPKTQAKSREAR